MINFHHFYRVGGSTIGNTAPNATAPIVASKMRTYQNKWRNRTNMKKKDNMEYNRHCCSKCHCTSSCQDDQDHIKTGGETELTGRKRQSTCYHFYRGGRGAQSGILLQMQPYRQLPVELESHQNMKGHGTNMMKKDKVHVGYHFYQVGRGEQCCSKCHRTDS